MNISFEHIFENCETVADVIKLEEEVLDDINNN